MKDLQEMSPGPLVQILGGGGLMLLVFSISAWWESSSMALVGLGLAGAVLMLVAMIASTGRRRAAYRAYLSRQTVQDLQAALSSPQLSAAAKAEIQQALQQN